MFHPIRRSGLAPGALLALVVLVTLPALALPGPSWSCDTAHGRGVVEVEAAGELPSVDELLERYVEAIGGRDAVAALRTRVAEMHLVTDLQRETPVYEVDTLSVYGTSAGEFLVVTKTPRGVILEGFDGNEDWRIDVDGTVQGHHPRGPRDSWMTDPQFPLKLRSHFPDMSVVGEQYWGGERVYAVDIDGDESHRLGFDVETGLLTRLGYNRELRDSEKVDGVLVPRRVAISRKGGSSTYYLDSIAHNTTLDRAIFSLAK